MRRDKQLCGIKLHDVLQKRRLDQALNAKEFAVLTGISYSTARAGFRLCGFPAFRGLVFWPDFVQWRKVQTGLSHLTDRSANHAADTPTHALSNREAHLPPRATQILGEGG